MAISPEAEAAIIQVAGDWTRHLANIEPRLRKRALARMVQRYKAIRAILQEIHES